MGRIPITREGYHRLMQELQRLQKEERPKVIQAIEEARGHGDLSENAEYEAAKDKQALIEGRIADLQQKLSQCEVVEPAHDNGGKVMFGHKVVLEDLDSGETLTYTLVGPFEADIQAGTLSITAPLGQAIIGKEEGDEVRVKTPKGLRVFEVVEVLQSGSCED